MKHLYLIVVLFSLPIFAQQKTLTGNVTDQNYIPIPYIAVSIKNSDKGTTTDSNGNYKINISNSSPELIVFSAIGYKTVTKKVTGNTQSELNIVMIEDLEQL